MHTGPCVAFPPPGHVTHAVQVMQLIQPPIFGPCYLHVHVHVHCECKVYMDVYSQTNLNVLILYDVVHTCTSSIWRLSD